MPVFFLLHPLLQKNFAFSTMRLWLYFIFLALLLFAFLTPHTLYFVFLAVGYLTSKKTTRIFKDFLHLV